MFRFVLVRGCITLMLIVWSSIVILIVLLMGVLHLLRRCILSLCIVWCRVGLGVELLLVTSRPRVLWIHVMPWCIVRCEVVLGVVLFGGVMPCLLWLSLLLHSSLILSRVICVLLCFIVGVSKVMTACFSLLSVALVTTGCWCFCQFVACRHCFCCCCLVGICLLLSLCRQSR